MTSVSKYITDIKAKYKEKYSDDEFIDSCSVAGGFNLPSQDVLKYLKIDQIFERLFKAGNRNLVFASEMGEAKKKVTINRPFGQDEQKLIRGLVGEGSSSIEDTCFITSSTSIGKATNPSSGPYKLVPVNENGDLVASIHLSGDGPIGSKEETKTISAFIEKYLPKDEKICMFCGDTNITEEKSGVSSREEIGQQIASALHQLNGKNWLVFMSDLKVDKMRSGFLLYNQQLKKSTYKKAGEKSEEADGTILAIRIPDNIESIDVTGIPDHYSCYTKTKTLKKSVERVEPVPIYTFSGPIGDSLNSSGQVVDEVFLDHSVLQLSVEKCNSLMASEVLPRDIRNVIVLNMGSIANSGVKNWNTSNIDYYDKIVTADKKLYELIKEHVGGPKFDEIVGSNFDKKNGIDKKTLTVDKEKYDELIDKSVDIIIELKLVINVLKNKKRGGKIKTLKKSRKQKSNKRMRFKNSSKRRR